MSRIGRKSHEEQKREKQTEEKIETHREEERERESKKQRRMREREQWRGTETKREREGEHACGGVENINVCLAVDEKEAVLCGTDGGRLGRVHDLQLTGLPALQVHVHAQRVEYKKKLAPTRRNRMKTRLPEYISRQVPFV